MRLLNGQKSGNAAAVGRGLRTQGLRVSDETIRCSFRRQGLGARVWKKKSLLTKRHRRMHYRWTKALQSCGTKD